MTHLAATPRPLSAGGAERLARYFWPIAGALLALRLVIDARAELVPDEAFYWTWTRHLSAGYFDHPPMVAWMVWVSTRLLGNTELAVRLPAAILSLGSLAVLVRLARRLLGDSRAVGFVIMMWIAGPLLPVIGTIHTPDASATFFSVCALACAVRISDCDDGNDSRDNSDRAGAGGLWVLFGLFTGLALLSKYTTVLVPGGVGLAMLTSRRGRAHLARPWPYLSALVALAVFSPVIYWNASHQWASFLFQLRHGASGDIAEDAHGVLKILLRRAGGLGEFVGGQAVVWTPVLFVVTLIVIVVNWGKYGRLRNADRTLLWCGTLPLIFFGWASTRSHGEINWPAFAYFPLSLLVARYLSENWEGNRVHWVRKGCEVALCFTVGVHLLGTPSIQQRLLKWHWPIPHQVTDLSGWREYGRQLAQRANGAPVVCNRHQDAGEAAFYMPGQPDVWCEGIGFRTTAFDYFDRGRPDYANTPRVLFVGRHAEMFAEAFHYPFMRRERDVVLPGLGKNRGRTVTLVERAKE
ncbi:MAG: hypothetical protein JWN51_1435 [Phycisphaerales bacterium]|nr:hypothetical protein [Phycisphaerales bacterium]